MTTKNFLRFSSLAAVLLAGSCAAPINNANGLVADGTVNHPITVEPTARVLTVAFAGPGAGLAPLDEQKVEGFVADYLTRGNGAISISVPNGPDSADTITWFGEHFAEMGVPRSRILVGQHDGAGVELTYVAYVARTDQCGDWSVNAADTESNLPMPDFGCSVQHNIAAMVADPRDLVAPRALSASDANRRATVTDKYEKGDITEADKHKVDKVNEQSGSETDVGK
jgi:pilus assembly protein CpaD